MKIERISFQQLFPTGQFQNQKLGIEASPGDNEDPLQVFEKLKATVEAAFKAMNPEIKVPISDFYEGFQPEMIPDIPAEAKTPKEQQISSTKEAISTCTSLKSLEIFKKLVDRENIEELHEAYNKKKKEFE